MCRHLARYYIQTHITKFGTGVGKERKREREREREGTEPYEKVNLSEV